MQHLVGERCVTGSCRLVQIRGDNILVDCGMVQGCDASVPIEKWPAKPVEVDFVFLTHAHIDHIGLLPTLMTVGSGNGIKVFFLPRFTPDCRKKASGSALDTGQFKGRESLGVRRWIQQNLPVIGGGCNGSSRGRNVSGRLSFMDRWMMELRRQRCNFYHMMLLACIINDFFQFRSNRIINPIRTTL